MTFFQRRAATTCDMRTVPQRKSEKTLELYLQSCVYNEWFRRKTVMRTLYGSGSQPPLAALILPVCMTSEMMSENSERERKKPHEVGRPA